MSGVSNWSEALTMDHTDPWGVYPVLRALEHFLSLLEQLLASVQVPGAVWDTGGWGGGRGRCDVAHHEELAEGDVGEDVVGLVLPTDLLGLLPEVRKLLG